jgi:type II secretory pathway pseudopilin PulG
MRAKYKVGLDYGALADPDERLRAARPRNGEGGFSLIEVCVAAVLTVGLMAVIFSIANRNQRVFVTESGVVEMNQSVRTAIDMLTRDIQAAGVGLPVANGNLAAIFCSDGKDGEPDSMMMLNGDPFAPVARVDSRAAGSAEFFLDFPSDVASAGNGANQQFSYKYIDADGQAQTRSIYKAFTADPRQYIVYDEFNAMTFYLTGNGQQVGNGDIKIAHNPKLNPPSVFGTVLTDEEPDYDDSYVTVLGSTVGYSLNVNTGELLRTENMTDWFAITRGIRNLQIQYRVILKNPATNKIEEAVVDNPGVDLADSGALTSRRNIRSVIITIESETPDVPPGNPSYRRVTHRFEVAPRNLNLVNNTVPL